MTYRDIPCDFPLDELSSDSELGNLGNPLTRRKLHPADENVGPEHAKRLRALWDPQPLDNLPKKDLDRIDAENTFMRSQLEIAVKFI